MKRFVFALGLVAATSGVAFADDTRVRTSATVEVIDDKAQIDDVISRLKQAPPPEHQRADAPPADLKSQRPPLSTVQPPEKKGAVTPEKAPRWRTSHRERGSGTPERTERPRHVHP